MVEETTSHSAYRVRLYVDDAAVEEGATTASGAAVNDYDIFALGRTSGSTKGDYASCRMEQVALWKGDSTNPVLSDSDNSDMFSGRIAPRDAETELDIAREPDLAYWILAGHARSGLRINSSQGAQLAADGGELVNEVGVTFPPQQIQGNTNPPRWSAKTPIFRWRFQRKGILVRPRKTARSRLQPRFVFFQEPLLGRSSVRWPNPPDDPTPLWAHPNFEYLGQSQFGNAGALRPLPSAKNTPVSDLAVVAAAMADWLAFQGFSAGGGSEGAGQYEGSLYLRGIGRGGILGQRGAEDSSLFGWDLPHDDPANPFGVDGEYSHIPLTQHPFDHVEQATSPDPEVIDIWNVWYMDNGVALGREWSEHFWQAFKEELDERGLCYPARLHWDYEHQPDWNTAMKPPPSGQSEPIGNWEAMVDDPRFGDDDHPVYVDTQNNEMTLEAVDATRAARDPQVPAPEADKSPWEDNIAATNWLGGWIIAMRNSALFRAVIEPAVDHFEHMRWGNYNDFLADHPDYKEPRRGPTGSHDAFLYNTPDEVTDLHADFSTPVMWASTNPTDFMRTDGAYHMGATPSSLRRGIARAKIDACINSRHRLETAPWIGGPDPRPGDRDTMEDTIAKLTYAWQRGVVEFLMFVWDPGPKPEDANDAWDQTWFACNHLLDQVHMLPQAASGARVARMSRLGRRQ